MKICIFLMFQRRKLGCKWREMEGGGDISGGEGGEGALFRGNQNMNSVFNKQRWKILKFFDSDFGPI